MIKAQALIGTMLGTCVLQKFIGKGDMGGVFLAQQSPPDRQVAVKILSPTQSQLPAQRAAFSGRFQREIGIATALKHPHILPIYEHGEQDGFSYLVMPYIASGTLSTILEAGTQLDFVRVITYLEQLALALDYAHEQGSIHRNLKPANVLVNSEGGLLLTDFGMMSIVAERQTSQMRSLKAGTPIGTFDYIAPEQVIGDTVDARTDLYALGVILYQMITGKTPFQGTPVQIAAQHVQSEPPSPRLIRADLPVAAEQVIIRAMAKRPTDRYSRAQDMASAFRVAITAAGLQLDASVDKKVVSENAPSSPLQPTFLTRSRGLFDPIWQQTAQGGNSNTAPPSQAIRQPTNPLPSVESRKTPPAPARLRLGLKANLIRSSADNPISSENTREGENDALAAASTGKVPQVGGVPASPTSTNAQSMSLLASSGLAQALPSSDGEIRQVPFTTGVDLDARKTATHRVSNPTTPLPTTMTTGKLAPLNNEQTAATAKGTTVKLAGAMKVVKVPIAGQPGRYITGLLPVQPTTEETPSVEKRPIFAKLGKLGEFDKFVELGNFGKLKHLARNKTYQKIFAAALIVLLIVTGTGIFLLRQGQPGSPSKGGIHAEMVTPDLQSIQSSEATATARANTILADPLTQNIHGWPIQTSGSQIYQFVNGAYHITDNNTQQSAPALLPDFPLPSTGGYTLTMDEIRGDDTSINNSFGMILDFNSRVQGKSTIVTFYSFEVLNKKGGEYQFWKYDNSKGGSPWTKLWHQGFGNEYHEGQGPNAVNTVNVFVNGKSFTFTVNGKRVGTSQDSSLTGGEIGMLVNLKGTEVAFSNLKLSYS